MFQSYWGSVIIKEYRNKKRAKVLSRTRPHLEEPPSLKWGSFHLSRLSCVILSLSLTLKTNFSLIPIKTNFLKTFFFYFTLIS